MKLPRPLSLVKAGDPISASAQNRLIQQVQENSAVLGTGPGSPSQNRVVLRCQNISGEDFEIGEAVAWKDVLSVTASGEFNPREAVEDAVYSSERLTWHSNFDSLGVVLDDTPDGDFGRIIIGGLTVVRLSSSDGGSFGFSDPATPKHWKLNAYAGYRVVDQINDDWAIVNLSMNQPRWIAELTENSNGSSDVTTAKLLDFDLSDFSATEIEITDPLGILDGYLDGYQTRVQLEGNRFVPGVGPCAS